MYERLLGPAGPVGIRLETSLGTTLGEHFGFFQHDFTIGYVRGGGGAKNAGNKIHEDKACARPTRERGKKREER